MAEINENAVSYLKLIDDIYQEEAHERIVNETMRGSEWA